MKKNEEKVVNNNELIKVIFINAYIGDLGIYYKGKTYELTNERYKLFKNDCKEVE
jgi:hypothetical protein